MIISHWFLLWPPYIFFTLPNRFFYDHFGTVTTRFLAIFLYTTSTLIVALSIKAVGGILFLMTNMQVGNLFDSHRSTIITVYNGAFDSSSAIFLIIKVLCERRVSLRSSFLFLSACKLIHLLRILFLMPKSHIPHPIPDNYKYGCAKSHSYNVKQYEAERDLSSDGGRDADDEPLETDTLKLTDNSEKGHLIWLSVMHLWHYFIGTLNPMLNRLANQDPVLCALWNGLLMDRHKRKPLDPGVSEREADLCSCVLSLLLTSLQCLLFSICASVPFPPLQYVTFILQVLNHSFLNGGNAEPFYVNLCFPIHYKEILDILITFYLNFDSYVNIILTVLTLLAFILPFYVFLHCRELAKQRENSQSILEDSIQETSMYSFKSLHL
uniref:Solute carrier family 43 member 3a n=1 Tax=Cyprinus carpio TaxID=7962 RepID=A0A8C1IF87_CYPCA